MFRLLFYFIVLVAAVWAGLLIAQDPGYAFFAYKKTSIEMPLWLFFFLILAGFFILYVLLRVLLRLRYSFKKMKLKRKQRRLRKAHQLTSRGLIEFAEGHWRSAERVLIEAAKKTDAPLVNYITAAQAAHVQGAYDRRDGYLRQGHECEPDAQIAIGLTQAQLQLNQGQLEQALATLKHLHSLAPKHDYVLKQLRKLYEKLHDWQHLKDILPTLKKYKLVSKPEARTIEHTIDFEKLKQAITSNEALDVVEQRWETLNKSLKFDSKFVEIYCDYLLAQQQYAAAEPILAESIKRQMNSGLVCRYSQTKTSTPKRQLTLAEAWLKHHPNDAVLLYTCGVFATQSELWGKAKDYLQASLAQQSTQQAHFALACLLEQRGEMDSAREHYKEAIKAASIEA